MKVYVAASVMRAASARSVAEEIEQYPELQVMTRRYYEDFTADSTPARNRIVARSDIRDLTMSDVFVYYDSPVISAGRNTELGYALAMGKPIFILNEHNGSRSENVFFSLAEVRHYKNVAILLKDLRKMAERFNPPKGRS